MNAATLNMPRIALSSAQRTLLLLLALSLLPIAIGAGLYFFGWQPGKTANHGTLITPPVAVGLDGVKGKWSLLLVGDSGNADRLDELRRVRVVLAKEWQRTQHLALDARPAALADLPAGTVVIVDPNGLAMMRYPPGADAQGIRADLERLLKYSWIG
ncbi:hypothetical protein [Sulfurisoma sediminicola]|uniref:Cytochrome oxidase Cu insertion factor (SCO1/SenC/PrrC family) n=1 Tax=Sulfurisoma sediminicola TaxID=1381557 RepID=A0A497XJ70_9PROT|nr:hypothetical protein [Sulfurisoma sediminicola]RLJ67973.1 hypothetical protein DFR35_0527 [Sulfurisoma sediminicola]